jgi:hypothetical protein
MALVDSSKYVDTILGLLGEEKPLLDSLVDYYFWGSGVHLFAGNRATIPESDLPAIEVYTASDTPGWFAPRIQKDDISVNIDVTSHAHRIEDAHAFEAVICHQIIRILFRPANLQTPILGTRFVTFDSLPGTVSYGQASQSAGYQTARIPWTGKLIEFLSQEEFWVGAGAPDGCLT